MILHNTQGGALYTGERWLLLFAWIFGLGLGAYQGLVTIAVPAVILVLTVVSLYVIYPNPIPDKTFVRGFLLPVVLVPLLGFLLPAWTLPAHVAVAACVATLVVYSLVRRARGPRLITEWACFGGALLLALSAAACLLHRNVMSVRFPDERQFYRSLPAVPLVIAVFYGYVLYHRIAHGRDRNDFFSRYAMIGGHVLSLLCLALFLNSWIVIRGVRADPRFETKELFCWGDQRCPWEMIPHVLRK
jgi:hypothetical protein